MAEVHKVEVLKECLSAIVKLPGILCYKPSGVSGCPNKNQMISLLPTVEFQFDNNWTFTIPPKDYLVDREETVCFGFAQRSPRDFGMSVGNRFIRNFEMTFDYTNGALSMGKSDCISQGLALSDQEDGIQSFTTLPSSKQLEAGLVGCLIAGGLILFGIAPGRRFLFSSLPLAYEANQRILYGGSQIEIAPLETNFLQQSLHSRRKPARKFLNQSEVDEDPPNKFWEAQRQNLAERISRRILEKISANQDVELIESMRRLLVGTQLSELDAQTRIMELLTTHFNRILFPFEIEKEDDQIDDLIASWPYLRQVVLEVLRNHDSIPLSETLQQSNTLRAGEGHLVSETSEIQSSLTASHPILEKAVDDDEDLETAVFDQNPRLERYVDYITNRIFTDLILRPVILERFRRDEIGLELSERERLRAALIQIVQKLKSAIKRNRFGFTSLALLAGDRWHAAVDNEWGDILRLLELGPSDIAATDRASEGLIPGLRLTRANLQSSPVAFGIPAELMQPNNITTEQVEIGEGRLPHPEDLTDNHHEMVPNEPPTKPTKDA